MSARRAAAAVVALAAFLAPVWADDLERRLDQAVRSYDAEAAQEVVSALRAADRRTELRVRAGLALAELLRLEYEWTPEANREARRVLGGRIDAAAEEALGLLGSLSESSERERMRADLLATMIRSDYRAKRFEDELRAAVDRALALDPDNPRALVAAAKPLLFAPPERGRDLAQGVAVLDRALALEPELEPALLLKAHALELLGRDAEARALYREVLAANPASAPAREALSRGDPRR